MRPLRKLTDFSPSRILQTLNQLIDEVKKLQIRPAPGTKVSRSSKGVTVSAAPGNNVTNVSGGPTTVKARWG